MALPVDKIKKAVDESSFGDRSLAAREIQARGIAKDVDKGMSMDAIVGKYANKRTTNTDEIRKIVKDYKFKSRMKKEDKDYTQGYMDHMKKVNKGEVNKYPNRGKGKPLSQDRKDALFGKKKNKNEDAEYEPHMMYKGTKKDYKAKYATQEPHHDSLNKAGYDHDDPETKKIEEKATYKTDPKLSNLKLSDIPSDYEKRKYAAQTSKKNEDVEGDLPTTNQRTQRMLNLIRANNPSAKNDFEAILLSLAKAKKNLSNDEDQADIAALRQDVDGLKLLVNQMKGKVDGLNESATLITEAQFDEAAGEKDACYRKVKSRYKVWPSAYASGALVQCRKKGAANWGNSKKK